MSQEVRGDLRRLLDCAAPDTQLGIDHGWVVEEDVLFTLGCAVLFGADDRHRRFDQPLGQFARVGDGRGSQDELRVAAIKRTEAAQPAEHVGHMRAEDAPVDVHLVDDDDAQGGEERCPPRVLRQDAHVQHVGVGEDDACSCPESWSAGPTVCRRRRLREAH